MADMRTAQVMGSLVKISIYFLDIYPHRVDNIYIKQGDKTMETIIAHLQQAVNAENQFKQLIAIKAAKTAHDANRFHSDVRSSIDVAWYCVETKATFDCTKHHAQNALDTAILVWDLYKAGNLI